MEGKKAALIPSKHTACYDLLRILASFFVVVIHVCSMSWQDIPINSIGWQTLNVYDGLVHCAVPLFVMISGTVFLRKEQPLEPKTVLTKYVLKLFVVFLCWSAFYAVASAGYHNMFTRQWIKNVLIHCADYEYHLWFFPKMIVAYLLLPLLWPLVHYKDGKPVGYACLLFLVLRTGIAMLAVFPLPKAVLGWFANFSIGTIDFVGYMLIGYYLSTVQKKKPKLWLTILVLVISSAVIVFGNAWMAMRAEEATSKLFSTSMLPVAIQSAAVFSLFTRLEQSDRINRAGTAISRLAGYTLGIYVIHIFVLTVLQKKLNITVAAFGIPAVLSVPLLALFVFAVSFAITFIIKKLPFFKKWLV